MRKLISVLGIGLLLSTASAYAQDDAEDKAEAAEASAEEKKDDGESTTEEVKEGTQAVASDVGLKGTTTSSYGPAGCGLGSLIFSADSGFTQVFAATTNGSSGTQTFGITSGTSNCDGRGEDRAGAEAFIQTNRAALAKDIARGRGETISTLTELASCKDSRGVGAKLQKNFRTIFPNAKVTDEQVSASVVRVLQNDASLSCSSLI